MWFEFVSVCFVAISFPSSVHSVDWNKDHFEIRTILYYFVFYDRFLFTICNFTQFLHYFKTVTIIVNGNFLIEFFSIRFFFFFFCFNNKFNFTCGAPNDQFHSIMYYDCLLHFIMSSMCSDFPPELILDRRRCNWTWFVYCFYFPSHIWIG